MVIRTKLLIKHLFENQHKFKKVVRLCSSSLRVQEIEDVIPNNVPNLEDYRRANLNIPDAPYLRLKPNENEELNPSTSFKFTDLHTKLAAPYQLQPKPDNSDLQFGKYFTDHMLKIFFYKQLGGWQTPEIIPFENLVLHPAAKVLHYAIELFEGMKAFRGEDDQIRIFRPELNMERMNISAVRAGLPTFSGDEMIKCLNRLISIDQEWVPHCEAASLYIRPTLIGIDPTLGVASSESALLYAILSPVGSYFKSASDGSVSLLADPSYTRAWPGGVGDRKMGSNYAPTVDIQNKASEKGLHQVLWLYGEDHQLTEAGTMNIFMVSIDDDGEKVLSTPPLNGLILPGVTRHSIIQLARHWGLRVKETPIRMGDVIELRNQNRLLELFGSGTACVVSPIGFIDYMNEGILIPTLQQPECVFKKIRETLLAIQYGHVEHPWAKPI
ncbi:branched chain amino acid transaminase [Arctopsyche grandis]|uniref:branched chain amino acid transaminase n=1 Tax=Arctopsyche grandis TaxID=121162 RepID=UPI00406D96D7